METSSVYPDDGRRNKLTSMFETNMALSAFTHPGHMAKNMVMVPLVIRLGLCKLASIAVGRAQAELLHALEITNNDFKHCYVEVEEALLNVRYSDMILLNKMYVNNTNDVEPAFFTNSTVNYGIHIEKVNFNKPRTTTAYINHWVESATYQRIRDLLEENDVKRITSIMLLSAAHVKCSWEFSFSLQNTKTMKFKGPFKTVEVPMMSKTDSFLYYKDSNNKFQILQMFMLQPKLMMTFILPERKDMLPVLAQRFRSFPKLLRDAKNRMRMVVATIKLPRFKIKSNLELSEVIKHLGVNQIFNKSFSGLEAILRSHKEAKRVYLSLIKQKVFIEVDEFGTSRNVFEAQNPIFTPKPPMYANDLHEFIADRPFMFSVDIVLSPVGHHTELLLGAYYGPED